MRSGLEPPVPWASDLCTGLYFLLMTHLQSRDEAIPYEYACRVMRAWDWGSTWEEA